MLQDHFSGAELGNRFRKSSFSKQSSPIAARRPSHVAHIQRRRLRISYFADPRKTVKDKICVNVSGKRYQLTTKRLSKYPHSLLSDEMERAAHYDLQNDEFFFDRNRTAFESVYHFYQTNGILIWPDHIPTDLLTEELKFYGLYDYVETEDKDALTPPVLAPTVSSYETESLGTTAKLQKKMWKVLEEPDASIAGQIWGLLSCLAILISVIIMCIHPFPTFIGTNPSTNQSSCTQVNSSDKSYTNCYLQNVTETAEMSSSKVKVEPVSMELFYAESVCLGFFTFEYILRFLASPQKCSFPFDFLNLIDLAAILPYYIGLALSTSFVAVPSLAFLRIIHLTKLFRILKQRKFYHGVRVMALTVKASLSDLMTLTFLILVATILFSSFVYYVENWNSEGNTEGRDFESIPASFWWAVITLTTVGYGDMVPTTIAGKLLATLCVVSGVLIITPILPIMYANFDRLYHLDPDPEQENKTSSYQYDKGTGLMETSGVSDSRTP